MGLRSGVRTYWPGSERMFEMKDEGTGIGHKVGELERVTEFGLGVQEGDETRETGLTIRATKNVLTENPKSYLQWRSVSRRDWWNRVTDHVSPTSYLSTTYLFKKGWACLGSYRGCTPPILPFSPVKL